MARSHAVPGVTYVHFVAQDTPERPPNACICALEAFRVVIGVVGTLVWCETDQKRSQTTLQHELQMGPPVTLVGS